MDGIILIDKPAGITSHDVVDRVRKIAKTRRVGHAGTLDPFATGLLILGINKGTKQLTGLIGLDKTYEATAQLGVTSTTDDPEGTVTPHAGTSPGALAEGNRPDNDAIERALARFRGSYEQTAPAFSAKWVDGKRLYDLARQGKIDGIALPKKIVSISELSMMHYAWPDLSFRVSCSSGTYIRALARDIGEALGCGAYLTALRRTRIGTYDIHDAVILDGLDERILMERLISKNE